MLDRVLPVLPELSRLLPGRGLRRGSTIAVATGPAAPGRRRHLAAAGAAGRGVPDRVVVRGGRRAHLRRGRRRRGGHRAGPARPGAQPRAGVAHRRGRPDRRGRRGGHRRAGHGLAPRSPAGSPPGPGSGAACWCRTAGGTAPTSRSQVIRGDVGRARPGPWPAAPPPGGDRGPRAGRGGAAQGDHRLDAGRLGPASAPRPAPGCPRRSTAPRVPPAGARPASASWEPVRAAGPVRHGASARGAQRRRRAGTSGADGADADHAGLVPGLAGDRRRDRRRGAGAPARSRCCTPTGCSPAPRRPGPRGSAAGCASGRRRAAAPS